MLKRYTTEELVEVATQLFLESFATDDKIYLGDKVRLEGKPVPEFLFEERTKIMTDIQNRIAYFKNMKNEVNEEDAKIYQEGIELLQKEYDRLAKYNTMAKQEKHFQETKDVYSTHTYLEVPLNKKLNGIYDSFNLAVLFYDELSTNKENIEKLKSLETKEEKINFTKGLVKITHMSLQTVNRGRAIIALQGEYNQAYCQIGETSCSILPKEYSDFSKVTLADCEKIKNNDLRQIVQECIDLDKEDLEVKADLNVRGDNYKILKSNDNYYIRYICPSTGRVYYNSLSFDYLTRSQYFKKDDFNSYILAWYSINNLFMDLTDEVLEENAIRC